VPHERHPFVVGGLYEDCAYHPCLCIEVDEAERGLIGISLMDGSLPRSCSIDHCGPEVITVHEAVLIRVNFDAFEKRRMTGVAERVSRLQPLATGVPAELPQVGGRSLVAMDQVIEGELVDLTGIQLGEALADSPVVPVAVPGGRRL
jgi:hypothetical protein